MKFLVLVLCLSFSGFSFAQSFASGNKFTTKPISGDVMVQCTDPHFGLTTQHFECEDNRLSPEEFDYFVGPQVDADNVVLVSTYENGITSKEKSAGYKNGKSSSHINLWISSLFQHPLLAEGLNKISYVLKKSGQVVGQGQFDVQVAKGETRRCPSGFYMTPVFSDCQNPYMVCDQYFQQYNYCQ